MTSVIFISTYTVLDNVTNPLIAYLIGAMSGLVGIVIMLYRI